MARGAQKIQSQEKAAKKRAQQAKANAAPISEAQKTADKMQCDICKTFVKRPAKGNYLMAQQHNEAKHPKNTLGECFPLIPAMMEADKVAAEKEAKKAKKAAKSGSSGGGGGGAKASKGKKKKEDLSFLDEALGGASAGKKKKKASSKK